MPTSVRKSNDAQSSLKQVTVKNNLKSIKSFFTKIGSKACKAPAKKKDPSSSHSKPDVTEKTDSIADDQESSNRREGNKECEQTEINEVKDCCVVSSSSIATQKDDDADISGLIHVEPPCKKN